MTFHVQLGNSVGKTIRGSEVVDLPLAFEGVRLLLVNGFSVVFLGGTFVGLLYPHVTGLPCPFWKTSPIELTGVGLDLAFRFQGGGVVVVCLFLSSRP